MRILLWDPRSERTPKWGFRVASLPVGALCFYQAHFGRTVLPKWPFWAHLFYSTFYSVSEFGRACFRQARVTWAMFPPGALFRAGAFTFLPCAPKSHLHPLPHLGPSDSLPRIFILTHVSNGNPSQGNLVRPQAAIWRTSLSLLRERRASFLSSGFSQQCANWVRCKKRAQKKGPLLGTDKNQPEVFQTEVFAWTSAWDVRSEMLVFPGFGGPDRSSWRDVRRDVRPKTSSLG